MAMLVDFAPHFVVARLRRGNKDDPSGAFGQLLGVMALAAARSAKQEGHRLSVI
jgi:hypothetical protein